MKNPREIEVVKTKSTYKLPTYIVTNKGLEDASEVEIKFVKGDIKDDTVFRQDGIMVESLITLAIEHLKANNIGNLENEHNTNAIGHLETALYKLDQRQKDRKERDVQGTYQK
jgi:hypothetical protein